MSRFSRRSLRPSLSASVLVGLLLCSSLARGQVAPVAPPSAVAEGEERDRAEVAYETAFILFEDEYAAQIDMRRLGPSVRGSVTITREAVPIRGIQRERLSPVAFYVAVGRADLAAEYRRGRRKKLVVGGASLGAVVTSGVLLGVGMLKMVDAQSIDLNCSQFAPTIDDPSWTAYDACSSEEDRQIDRATGKAGNWLIGSGVAIVGAFALGAIYGSMDPHPVSEADRRMLANDHNARIRRNLRLPRRRPDVSLAPFVSAEAAGFMAIGRF